MLSVSSLAAAAPGSPSLPRTQDLLTPKSTSNVDRRNPQPSQGWFSDAAGPAMLSQVLSTLRAAFSINATPAIPQTALTPAESAEQGFTAAVSQALQAADPAASPPSAAIGAVRSTVEQALQDVTQYLLANGAAPSDVDSAGGVLRHRLESLMAGLGANIGSGTSVAAQATLTQRQKATIELVTAEGDIVKLSFRSRTSSSVDLAAAATVGGAVAGTAGYTTINSSRLSIEVQGNINADEAAAIGDVLNQVETLANQFFAGDVAQAFASAAALHIDSAQLASVALQLGVKQSIQATAVGETAPAAPTDPVASTSPLPSSASTVPVPVASTPVALPVVATPAAAPAAAPGTTVLQDFLAQVLKFTGGGESNQALAFNARAKLELLVAAIHAANAVTPHAASTTTSAVAKFGDVAGHLADALP